jgi:hypothetical protein
MILDRAMAGSAIIKHELRKHALALGTLEEQFKGLGRGDRLPDRPRLGPGFLRLVGEIALILHMMGLKGCEQLKFERDAGMARPHDAMADELVLRCSAKMAAEA